MSKDEFEIFFAVFNGVVALIALLIIISKIKHKIWISAIIIIISVVGTGIIYKSIKPSDQTQDSNTANDIDTLNTINIPTDIISQQGINEGGTHSSNGNNKNKKCLMGDCENGYGKLQYASGEYYEGYFKNGFREGKGKVDYPNRKCIYYAEFLNDKPVGWGFMVDYNGDTISQGYIENEP